MNHSHTVVNYIYLHTFRTFQQKEVGELPACFVVTEKECFQVDMVLLKKALKTSEVFRAL
jgi:hypothetical protein